MWKRERAAISFVRAGTLLYILCVVGSIALPPFSESISYRFSSLNPTRLYLRGESVKEAFMVIPPPKYSQSRPKWKSSGVWEFAQCVLDLWIRAVLQKKLHKPVIILANGFM